jgi:hypothetical protein
MVPNDRIRRFLSNPSGPGASALSRNTEAARIHAALVRAALADRLAALRRSRRGLWSTIRELIRGD